MEESTRKIILKTLKTIGAQSIDDDCAFEVAMSDGVGQLVALWKKRDSSSEIAFKGLLAALEFCLAHGFDKTEYFEKFVDILGYNTVQFWRGAVQHIYDSDMSRSTKYRDSLLFSLTLYDVNTGKNRLHEFYAAVPGLRKSLLGFHAKRFGEQFHHLQRRKALSRTSLNSSNGSLTGLGATEMVQQEGSRDEIGPNTISDMLPEQQPRRDKRMSIGAVSNTSAGEDDSLFVGGLAHTHFQQRVINVSNAPPVSVSKEKTGEWQIKQGSGGLVSCVDPIMSINPENVWLANLGMNIDRMRIQSQSTEKINAIDDKITVPTTNTLGLPLMKQANADVFFHVLADDDINDENEPADKKKVREEMSLLGVLNTYNRGNYKLSPVVVQEQDYNVYYGGISNGLLWPALHNLPEYIAEEYEDKNILNEHWCAYVRVNYQFAIDAVRNSRPQDFIWIHDYHLMLTGMIMQSLDQDLEVGFFLHIPFLPPENFFTQYALCSLPILRGLLRFTKVGFQTHRDRAKFLELVEKHLPSAKISPADQNLDVTVVNHMGWNCSLGVFPVSIKNEDFLKIAKDPETIMRAQKIRQEILGEKPVDGAQLFFSVERFDYTKGIKEKLLAYERYLQKYPDRLGKDVLIQVAVVNRRSVDTYRIYQDECIEFAESINKQFVNEELYHDWKPLIFRTTGLQRVDLIAHYLAMDIGVVTPKKDGMNLVAKEMLICNPSASLILSTGAGSEFQFTMAGLYSQNGDTTYHRVEDVFDTEAYADTFYKAAIEAADVRATHGKALNEFIMNNDIERWSTSFLDPSWSHLVIRTSEITTLDSFFQLMMSTRDVRRSIVERVLKGIPIRSYFSISLRNAKESLEMACRPNTTMLCLRTDPTEDTNERAELDVKDEIDEFDKDLNFLSFIQSDDVYNVEKFIASLQSYHPISEDKFRDEVCEVVDMFSDADHFDYFFTDRDGTLKSYSCSYAASIQPAYSGVIQAQFARRCAQTCAIVTTAPLMRIGILDVLAIPEGYYYIGSSAGREWFVDPTNKFKDQSIPERDLELLDKVFDSISDMLEEPNFKHFHWIGSGLQKHYGHVTLAHQDAYGSVPRDQKEAVDKKIRAIVERHDKSQKLEVKATDTDIKVFIKSKTGGIFNKGHGLKLLVEYTKVNLCEGTILVCGDSNTDIPMLTYCLEQNPRGVFTVWVTMDEELRQKVREMCKKYDNSNYVFVSCPEVLLGGMAQATIREISICRPRRESGSEIEDEE